MELNFKNKVVLITGAAGGIGSTLVRDFKSHGAIVYGTDISPSSDSNYIQGDLTNDQFLSDLVNGILEKEGRIDVLVNNAGIYLRTPAKDITRSEWERLMDINLTSVFFLTQLVIDKMISQKSGAIVSLASVAGKVGGLIAGAHYAASKAAVECLTKSLAKLSAAHGVRVNAVAPGIIDTSMQDGVPAEQMEFLMKNIPMGRLGTAAEVADAIVFLASDASSYITGQTISINGGTYM
ncbi:SDR family NAD(P)-dependent oxidoreductase [Pedobacter psychroterrae]|uniref:SDR family oxidoreductase n=1 Tax=Pedobacter psychroterrae TaxID=2530453 RepID=A0A4R0N9I3_9SPHI|nr:SDR family NAD(P)-dependent oxidoreductase [Pedobacter psychroterrae]TCC96869.1 SDR family oxidoreductase [Pedobacter psychroterrae]